MSNVIHIESIVSGADGRPYVTLEWGTQSGQLTPNEARMHAMSLMEATDAAESDALIVKFLREKVGASDSAVVGVLSEFREYRTQNAQPRI